VRIGELVRELDKAERARTDLHPDAGTQTKTHAIAEAGLSRTQAYRYQELAGPREANLTNPPLRT
jgi:ACT domain-containing protein